MVTRTLTERQKIVLNGLIDLYIRSALPVGSRHLANRAKLGFSAATVRNVLQDLEEMGLVYQPHTSAGRIPTNKAYRWYVDNLMRIEPLRQNERDKIRQELSKGSQAIDQILEQACRVLADVSRQLGVSVAPRFMEGILTKLDLIAVAENRLLVVAAVKSGFVKSLLIEVDSAINPKLVDETAAVLNERLGGLSLEHIISTIHARFQDVAFGDPKLIKLFINSAHDLLTIPNEQGLHYMGTSHITAQPEFRDHQQLRKLITVLDERKEIILSLNEAALSNGVVVTIGKEANLGMLENCSLVTATYQAGATTGTIGVIGPTRMQYSKLMSIVDYTSRILSDILSKD